MISLIFHSCHRSSASCSCGDVHEGFVMFRTEQTIKWPLDAVYEFPLRPAVGARGGGRDDAR